ncbi:hypothetical protein BFO_2184 [Tannerella forsythia 92A2]|uniref:Uncharacterized protein n=1 Tax=Tannerella forsythia (strain ATCC 43037 / JCM 10827 / CCUG 21028 A / KCTC 5666 / FDC 338) TaxID=203275 RepID=G8UIN1_TANFA|nr:hypothetical protein BFO_2184 [Tannerella forsythia 92A2]
MDLLNRQILDEFMEKLPAFVIQSEAKNLFLFLARFLTVFGMTN